MIRQFKRFSQDERGATAVEYGLIAGLIAVGIIAGATALGDSIDSNFKVFATKLDDS